jgi:hypothetical protein
MLCMPGLIPTITDISCFSVHASASWTMRVLRCKAHTAGKPAAAPPLALGRRGAQQEGRLTS